MVTPGDHKKLRYLGRASAMTELATLVRGGTLPVEGAETYAAGMVEGVREFVTAYLGEKAAYDLLQTAADRTGAHHGVQVGPGAGS